MNDANAIKAFIKHHYRHFNSAALVDAAEGYVQFLHGGGKMFLAMAGAMSTAELGLSLAEMIRQDKIHGITCTGANLEEDIYNLVAHDHYVRIPNYRDLTPEDEHELLSRHLNRVTDTCIPEEEAIRRIEAAILEEWTAADAAGERYFPHEFLYRVLRSRQAGAVLPDRPQEQLDAGRLREEPADLRARLGRLHDWQHLRLARDARRRQERAHRAHRHRVHDGAVAVVHARPRRRLRSASSRSAAASPATSRSASCRCCTRTWSRKRRRCGATSARSATRPRATARTPAPCPTRRSPGKSSTSTRRSSSSSPTPRSSRRSSSPTCWRTETGSHLD